MKIHQLAAAAALAVAAAGASAAATDWSTHDPQEFGFGFAIGASTPLMDVFSFTLSAPSMLTTTAVSNESPTLNLSDAQVFLYAGPVNAGSFVSGFTFNSTSSSAPVSMLAAGAYYYVVSATVGASAVAGSYALTSQVSAVPEPETYALMLAGLGAGIFLSTRRSSGV